MICDLPSKLYVCVCVLYVWGVKHYTQLFGELLNNALILFDENCSEKHRTDYFKQKKLRAS